MDNGRIENGSSALAQPQDEQLLQLNLLEIALRHRAIILTTAVLSLVVAVLYLAKTTPIFTSASRIYVEQSGPKIISEYEGVMTRSKNYLYTQSELMRSTPIIADVVDDPQIKRLKTFNGVDNLIAYVKGNLDVVVGKKDDIITVSFDSPYSAEAAQIVNAVVDYYIKYHSARKQSTVLKVLNILQKEKVKRDAELKNKFEQMLNFTRENGIVSFDNSGDHIIFKKLAKLSDALTNAQLMAINSRADYEAVKAMADEPAKIKQFAAASPSAGIHVFVNDMETQLRAELRDAEIELKNIKFHVTEDHPAIKATHEKIDHLRNQLNKEAKEFAEAYTEVMRLRWVTALQRQQELDVSFETQRQDAQHLGIKAAEYSILQSELKRTEKLCDILDDRIKELNVTEDTGALNISILEVANPASKPSKPQKSKIMAMALVLGFMCGGALALLRDWMDFRLRSVDEIAIVLGIPVLGVVPAMAEERKIIIHGKAWLQLWGKIRNTFFAPADQEKDTSTFTSDEDKNIEAASVMDRARHARSELKSRDRKTYRKDRKTIFSEINQKRRPDDIAKTTTDSKAYGLDMQVIVNRGQKVYLMPKSIEAEAYRTIRTAVFFGVPKEEAKTILVTSPAPGDGKSTLASNLALAMAQAGQKILILDADFRKPMQHNIFQTDKSKGLSNVIAGAIDISQAIQQGPIKNLDVLACGREVPNPSEILNSALFAKLLENFAEQYDRIIIDSPPVGPVADSQILAATCDISLLVLRAEKSTRRQSQQARDALLSVGGRLLGCIVNDVPRKKGRYGYYSSYGHYGGYGYYGHKPKE
ncbi:MAG: polysaccharide biosynthesis tyrosine autokinase [Planctomycetes bacterium]|nr:polysaccharide biosynthesis tyrosine autokinase [Planctomycetota bacterium]